MSRYNRCGVPFSADCMGPTGGIFAVYPRLDGKAPPSLADVLQPGRRLAAAGYVLYGSATMLVLTTGDGVDGFVLDPSVGETKN